MRTKIFLAILVSALSFNAWAAGKFERGYGYSYRTRIWNDVFAGDGTKLLAKETMYLVGETIRRVFLQEKEINFNDNALEPQELLKIERAHRRVDILVDTVNKYIRKERENNGGGFTMSDVLPDALVVYLGPRLAAKLGIGTNFTGVVGAVIIPQLVDKIDNLTGKVVDTSFNLDVGFMAWGQAGVGAGLGASAAAIVGMGLLWNTRDNITGIEDISSGVGGGVTGALSFIGGVVVGGGAIYSFGFDSFSPSLMYLRAGITAGVQMEGSTSIAGQLFFSPAMLLGMLSQAQQKVVQDMSFQLSNELTAVMQDEIQSRLEQN